jgi:hypothetical protein
MSDSRHFALMMIFFSKQPANANVYGDMRVGFMSAHGT